MSREDDAGGGRAVPPTVLDAVGLVAILAIGASTLAALGIAHPLDCDEANLAFGTVRFDVLHHQPHPPGYVGYVALLRLVRALTGAAPLEATGMLARAFWAASVLASFGAARALARPRSHAPLAAAALVAFHPIALYYAVDGQTHAAEAFLAACLVGACLAPLPAGQERWRPLVVGLCLAIGGSLRPSFALVSLVPVLIRFRRTPRALAGILAIAVVGTAAWVGLTVASTPGGLEAFLDANRALVGSQVAVASLLASGSDRRHVVANLVGTGTWAALALAPWAITVLVLPRDLRRRHVEARAFVRHMVWPALLFFTFVLCVEAGYLAGLVPPIAIVTALLAGDAGEDEAPRHGLLFALGLGSLVGFFVLPAGMGRVPMMPVASEAFAREALHASLEEALVGRAPSDAHLLVLSDWPDPTALRGLPLRRPRTDVLFFRDSRRYAFHPDDAISLTTSVGAPTGIEVGRCDLSHRADYDAILVEPRASDALRARILAQSRCAAQGPPGERLLRLPTACFPDGTIRGTSCTFRFRSGRAPNPRSFGP